MFETLLTAVLLLVGVREVISFGPKTARDEVIDLLSTTAYPAEGVENCCSTADLTGVGQRADRTRCTGICVWIDMLSLAGTMATDAAEPVQP